MDISQQLAQEWTTLQDNFEAQERSALSIKLVTVLLFALARWVELDLFLTGALILILWVQEAVYKTWQARLGARLLALEAMLQRGPQGTERSFALHSQWLEQRAGLRALLVEYAQHAIRPTVAFPYVDLLLLAAVL